MLSSRTAAALVAIAFSPAELRRYGRHLVIPEIGLAGQERLRRARVLLVGAGPGAAAHLTLGAYQALQAADVVIHDRLVGPEIMALIPAHVARVDVGKEGFGPSAGQDAINAAIVAHTLSGARVVRLKSGDPAIFGRLEEEILALRAAGIEIPFPQQDLHLRSISPDAGAVLARRPPQPGGPNTCSHGTARFHPAPPSAHRRSRDGRPPRPWESPHWLAPSPW